MVRLSARTKLLLALVAILLFSFAGVSLLNYKITRMSIHEEILRKNLPLTLNTIYSEITTDLTLPLIVSGAMASDTFVKDWITEGEVDPGTIIRYLHHIKEKFGFFTAFFISANSGRYYRFSGIHKQIAPDDAHDVWYFDFLASGKEYNYDVDTDEADSNILTVFINYRVVDDEGQLLGVTGVGLKVEKVTQRIFEYQKKYQSVVYLTDAKGVIQIHPERTFIETRTIAELEGVGGINGKIAENTKEFGSYQFVRNGSKILLTVRYIDALDWFLCVEQNETEALRGARKGFINTVAIGLLVSVLIITLTWITINRYQDQLEKLAVSDELTGTANRRALESEFRRILYAHSRSGRLFSLLLLDLDGFKKVNDTLGHMVGDRLLVDIVRLIDKNVRPTDIFARWGGDEFVILTDSAGKETMILAERIRSSVSMAEFAGAGATVDDPRNLVTVSIGISGYREGDDLDAMLFRADKALYKCKASGGDAVEFSV